MIQKTTNSKRNNKIYDTENPFIEGETPRLLKKSSFSKEPTKVDFQDFGKKFIKS